MKTPQQSFNTLNDALGVDIYLKREDEHKYGSHKGRSIPFMIKKYYKEQHTTSFVISSSGNAAIAAIHSVQSHNKNNDDNLSLTVFVGKKIHEKKLDILQNLIEHDSHIGIRQVERPKQSAFKIQQEHAETSINLRQSTDDSALLGYYELAEEINNIPNLQAIFIPTSSATTALGLAYAFDVLSPSPWGGEQHPEIHIVQTTACHPIAEHFDTDFETTDTSSAGAIVDNIAYRKKEILQAIKKSDGSGWVINDEQIKQAQELLRTTCHIAVSANAILSLAGLQKSLKKGRHYNGVVVCILTGM